MREELEKHTGVAQREISAALQKFHDATGLIPASVTFNFIDTRSLNELGSMKRVATVGIVELHACM